MAMSPSQARIVDPVLTNTLRGYSNQEYVGNQLLPVVPVSTRGGKIVEFDQEHFIVGDYKRAPGANIAQTQYRYSSQSYSIDQDAVEAKIPLEVVQEASKGPGLKLEQAFVLQTAEKMRLTREYKQAQVARDHNSYPASNQELLSGTSQWSHEDSDPIDNVLEAREVVRKKIGKNPNQILIPSGVLKALKKNPMILAQMKSGVSHVTLALLKELFEVDEILVGSAVYKTRNDAQTSDVWGNDVILSYTAKGAKTQFEPSAFFSYELMGHPLVEAGRYDPDVRSWLYPIFDEVAPVHVGLDAAFLLRSVI